MGKLLLRRSFLKSLGAGGAFAMLAPAALLVPQRKRSYFFGGWHPSDAERLQKMATAGGYYIHDETFYMNRPVIFQLGVAPTTIRDCTFIPVGPGCDNGTLIFPWNVS